MYQVCYKTETNVQVMAEHCFAHPTWSANGLRNAVCSAGAQFLPCDGFPSTEETEQSLGIFWVVNLEMQINILQCMGQQSHNNSAHTPVVLWLRNVRSNGKHSDKHVILTVAFFALAYLKLYHDHIELPITQNQTIGI